MSDIGSELQISELAGLTRTDVTLAIAVAACERLAPLAAAVLRDRPPVPAAVCSELWTLVDAVEGDEVESPVAPGVRAAVGAALERLGETVGPLEWLPAAWLIAVSYALDYVERGDPRLVALAVGQPSEAFEAWSERWMNCRGFDWSSPEWRAEKYSFDVVVAEAGWQRLDLATARLDRLEAAERIATIRSRAVRAGMWLASRLDDFQRECVNG